MTDQPKQEESMLTRFMNSSYAFLAMAFAFAWALAGVLAFIFSITCVGFQGSFSQKALGLIIAMMFGPFYWIFYYFVPGYCKESAVANVLTGGLRRRR